MKLDLEVEAVVVGFNPRLNLTKVESILGGHLRLIFVIIPYSTPSSSKPLLT